MATERIRRGFDGLVDVRVVEPAALIGAGRAARGTSEVGDAAGRLVLPHDVRNRDLAVDREALLPEAVEQLHRTRLAPARWPAPDESARVRLPTIENINAGTSGIRIVTSQRGFARAGRAGLFRNRRAAAPRRESPRRSGDVETPAARRAASAASAHSPYQPDSPHLPHSPHLPTRPVNLVPDQRMSQRLHVQSNLMLPPGVQLELDQRRVVEALADGVVRHRLAPALVGARQASPARSRRRGTRRLRSFHPPARGCRGRSRDSDARTRAPRRARALAHAPRG